MSDVITRAKTWEIATLRKSKEGKVFLAFDKNVKILVGDREVDLGKYKTLFADEAVASLNFLLEKEYIDQDEYDKRVSTIEEKGIKSIVKGKLI